MKPFSRSSLVGILSYARENLLSLAIIAVIMGLLMMFFIRIPGSAAPAEHETVALSSTLQSVIDNPLNAPYKLLVNAATTVASTILAVRALSFLLFTSTVIALFYVLKLWHTRSVAILTTLAFATNAISLATGRLGTPLIMVFGWFIFTALLLWQVHGKSSKIIPALAVVAVPILLYTPGALWFFVLFLLFYRNRFLTAFKNIRSSWVISAGVVGLAVISPLIAGFVQDPHLILEWLLIPDTLSLSEAGRSALDVIASFFYSMPSNPLLSIGTVPVFDVASGFLFLAGLNAYRRKLQLDRTRLMIAIALLAIVLGALGNVMTAVAVLLPFMYSVVAAGIEYLWDEWSAVFPKNPFAKGFGMVVLTTVVLFGTYYQLTRFLVAWPQTPETKQVYSQPRILNGVDQ